MKKMKWLSLLLAAAMIAVTLFAMPAAASVPEDVELAEDQTLHLLLGSNVSTFDDQNAGWQSENFINSAIYERLFRPCLDENGNDSYELSGALSYDVSEDDTVWTFHLREMQWSDGVPVTAQNYVDAFVRALNPENALYTANFHSFIKNGAKVYTEGGDPSELGVKAIDDLTLELTFEAPDIDAIPKIAMICPIRQDLVDAATVEFGTKIDELAFNGPFVITEFIPDNKVVLEKNPTYWDAENITLDRVELIYAAEYGTQATLFDSQQLDIVGWNEDYADTWDAEAEAGNITKIVLPEASVMWLEYNMEEKTGTLANEKVRKAISLAIDRQEFCDVVYGGRYTPAWNYVPYPITVQGHPFNSVEDGIVKQQQAEYDTPEKLQALLKEGLDEAGFEYNDLSDYVLNFTEKAASVQDQTRIEYLKQTWENVLGITVDVDVVADYSYQFVDEPSFGVTTCGWNGNYLYETMYLFDQRVGLPPLTGGLHDDDLQAAFDAAVGVTDPEEYISHYRDAENILVGKSYAAPIKWGDTIDYQQNYVGGIVYRNLSPLYEFTKAYIIKH